MSLIITAAQCHASTYHYCFDFIISPMIFTFLPAGACKGREMRVDGVFAISRRLTGFGAPHMNNATAVEEANASARRRRADYCSFIQKPISRAHAPGHTRPMSRPAGMPEPIFSPFLQDSTLISTTPCRNNSLYSPCAPDYAIYEDCLYLLSDMHI